MSLALRGQFSDCALAYFSNFFHVRACTENGNICTAHAHKFKRLLRTILSGIPLEATATLRLGESLFQHMYNSFMVPLMGSCASQSFTLSTNVGGGLPSAAMPTYWNNRLEVLNHLREPAVLSGNPRYHSSEDFKFVILTNALRPIRENRCLYPHF